MKKITLKKVAKGNTMDRDVTAVENKLEVIQVETAPVEIKEVSKTEVKEEVKKQDEQTSESTEDKPKKKKKERDEPTVEYRFSDSLCDSDDYVTKNNQLYSWEGNHWKQQEDVFLKRLAANYLGDEVRNGLITSCKEVALLKLPEMEKVSPNRIVIPCKDVYIEVKDGKIETFKPSKALGFTYKINANYLKPNEKKSLFMDYLNASVEPAAQRVLQEFAGYSLLPDTRYQKTMMLKGDGGEGKSILINILRALHPINTTIKLDALAGFSSSELLSSSLITCDEVPSGRIDEQEFKALVSGDATQLNRKNKDLITFKNKAKIILSGNHFPAIRDHSKGFWRRWIIVPFTSTVSEDKKDSSLAQKITDQELDYVLSWALEGLLRLMANGGKFSSTKAMEKEIVTLKKEADSVVGWMAEHEFTECPQDYVTNKLQVYNGYLDWTHENGLKKVSQVTFWKRMKSNLSFELDSKQKRIMGAPIRHVNFKYDVLWDEPVNDEIQQIRGGRRQRRSRELLVAA